MNPTSLQLNFAALPNPANRLVAGSPASMHRAGGPHPRAATPSSPSLTLAAACASEVRAGERSETTALLFLAGCAFAVVAGCAFHLERCLAQWSSFESFVRAALF